MFHYDAIYSGDVLSDADKDRIEAMFTDFSERILNASEMVGYQTNNRAAWCASALYQTSWFNPDIQRGRQLRELAIKLLRKNFEGIFPSGIYFELSPGYHSYASIGFTQGMLAVRNMEGVDLFHESASKDAVRRFFTDFYSDHFFSSFDNAPSGRHACAIRQFLRSAVVQPDTRTGLGRVQGRPDRVDAASTPRNE